MIKEKLLREWIRGILAEEDAPGVASSAPPTSNPIDAPIEKTPAEKDAERRAEGLKGDFDDDLADLLGKKMKDKGASETSINDMKKAVQDGR